METGYLLVILQRCPFTMLDYVFQLRFAKFDILSKSLQGIIEIEEF